jgi:hypothetical protein
MKQQYKYIKVRNRHGFVTIHSGNDIVGAEAPLTHDDWVVCHRDPDGNPWAWARLALPREAKAWLREGHHFGDWVES